MGWILSRFTKLMSVSQDALLFLANSSLHQQKQRQRDSGSYWAIIEEILLRRQRFSGHGGLIPYACDKDLLKGSVDLARELDLKLHIHVAETQNENKIS